MPAGIKSGIFGPARDLGGGVFPAGKRVISWVSFRTFSDTKCISHDFQWCQKLWYIAAISNLGTVVISLQSVLLRVTFFGDS